jgi:hypothetical protein
LDRETGDDTHGIHPEAASSNTAGGIRMLRKVLYWGGWILLLVYAVIYLVQGFALQDIPPVSWLKWGILAATALLIYAARNRDQVFEHHLPH